ncbi:MAG TPA: MFS transporter [Candidatus Corynebacterium avicola]|uniref:MFS transporter n=1 Tax=Candidatus Corynebacterium avicola TaxID=2838527 RepID=A0A9D1RRI5_9CORY|nr:MFS transporter [Candidatus Corynebacterium avicola]
MSVSPPSPGASHQSVGRPSDALTGRALAVWGAAVVAYVLAITGRTSLGVAGVEAMDHFTIDASRLAVFTSVQVGVYACAQIPMGMLIDRFGPRRMLVVGALLMGIGQVLLGATSSYPVAILARVIVGTADATAFLSVMRILPAWIPLRKTPVFTQLTGGLGYIGQFLSAVPFTLLLHSQGWTVAFASLGGFGVLVAVLVWLAVADTPDPTPAGQETTGSEDGTSGAAPAARPGIGAMLAVVVRHPACWIGFFVHFTLMSQVVFTLLWGKPLMTLGMGLSDAQASTILVVNMLVSVVVGPFAGIISARAGRNRSLVTLAATLIVAASWVVFFLPDAPRGFVAILVLNIILPGLAPVANYGFDTVREEVDRRFTATATGLSNMGGFTAAMIASQLVGLVLDYSADGDTYDWGDFRIAWCAMGLVWALGIVGLLVSRAKMVRWRNAKAAESADA